MNHGKVKGYILSYSTIVPEMTKGVNVSLANFIHYDVKPEWDTGIIWV